MGKIGWDPYGDLYTAMDRDIDERRTEDPSITCPHCGRTSWHPMDIKEKFCGACGKFHFEMGS